MNITQIKEDKAKDFRSLLGEDLADDLRRVIFHGIGVTGDDDAPLGALVYELKEGNESGGKISRIHLVSYKNEDVFSLLETEYEKAVADEGVTESYFETREKKPATRLKKAGFSVEQTESDDLVFDVAYLKQLPIAKSAPLPPQVDSISALSLPEYRDAVKHCLLNRQKGLLSDIAYLPKYWFEEEVSCAVQTGGRVLGLFLVRKTPENELRAVLYTAFGQHFQTHLQQMLLFTAQRVAEIYPPDTKIVICREHKNVRDLTAKLLPDLTGETVYVGRRQEQ